MKAVLISIQPKWCELIASGKKTVEVRKTKPRLETPFKCYIYETQGRTETPFVDEEGHEIFKGRGQVIGEFVCDRVDNGILSKSYFVDSINIGYDQTCVSIYEVAKYLDAYGAYGMYEFYGWHISDLVIYDKPKELSEFKSFCKFYYDCDGSDSCKYYIDGNSYEYDESDCGCNGLKPIERPPQSWMYAEELP